MPLEKSYKISTLAHLSHTVRNGIRAAYYSNAQVKNSVNQIDKSIKEDDLTPEQLAIMLQAIGRLDSEEPIVVKPATSSKEAELKQYEIALKNRENALNNRETKLSRQEKEFAEQTEAFDQKVKMLMEIEKKLNEKKEALNEKETRIQQQEAVLNQRKAELDKREIELQQRESTLNKSVDSDSKEDVEFLLEDGNVSQQVTGIGLRQSERTRLLSHDLERARLIYEASKEICNKWLQMKQGVLDAGGGCQTEKLVYKFVQDFIKSNFPYCGQAVYDLILYDLQKRREEMNGVSSQD